MKHLLVSGYRAHELQIFNEKHKGIPYIKQAIVSRLVPLIEDGLEWIVTPGQYGVDLWACDAVIGLKRSYPQLKLSIIAAYEQPEQRWNEEKQQLFHDILRGVDYYAAASRRPYDGVWQLRARDELLLRKTDGMLLVYDEDMASGSPRYYKEQALERQRRDGYRYIGISAEDIQSLVQEEAARAYE